MMLVFGGRGNDQGVVYALDLNTMKWGYLNNVKYLRRGHTANLIGNLIYLFGGYFNLDDYNDLHKYDVNSKTLQKVITSGQIPGARAWHGSAVIRKKLYIFGGYGSYNVYYNFYGLDTIKK